MRSKNWISHKLLVSVMYEIKKSSNKNKCKELYQKMLITLNIIFLLLSLKIIGLKQFMLMLSERLIDLRLF